MKRVSLLLLCLLLALPAIACTGSRPDSELTPTHSAAQPTLPQKQQPPSAVPPPTATPAPTATPGSLTVKVAADGSGEYTSLPEAVDTVPAGSTIILGKGLYRLPKRLVINKPLTLRGVGINETIVVGEGNGAVAEFSGPGQFAVYGITFHYEGKGWGDTVRVTDGEVDFQSCEFTGGARNEEERKGGSGLRLMGSTTGLVRGCRLAENQLHGITLLDVSRPTLDDNVARGNGENGITYFDESGGIGSGNDCSENGLHGIGVQNQSTPTLEGNTCSSNEQVGIRFSDESSGIARDNVVTGNGLIGIVVRLQAHPTLADNHCTGNTASGIVYFLSSAGTARGNTCSANGLHGISVRDQSTPTLEANTCSDNEEVGIRFSDESSGVARDNVMTGNGLSGIAVRLHSHPTLIGNKCNHNKQSGIAYFQNGSGTAQGNDCSANGLHGVDVQDQSTPTLEGNTCSSNEQAGIRFSDESSGIARDNVVTGNGLSGIIVRLQAHPTLIGNKCNHNEESGIAYFQDAAGTAQENECAGNRWGIRVEETADPDLIGNRCTGNLQADVDDRRSLAGSSLPVTEPSLGNIVFAEGVTDQGGPIRAATTFSTGTLEVYAIFDFEGMRPGIEFTWVYSRSGTEILTRTLEWDDEQSGTGHSLRLFYVHGSALDPGVYELRLFVEDKLLQIGTFSIGVDLPTVAPTPFSLSGRLRLRHILVLGDWRRESACANMRGSASQGDSWITDSGQVPYIKEVVSHL